MENYCPEVNSRLKLIFTEGAIIFHYSPSKRAVTICFIHHFHRFFSPYQAVKSGKLAIKFQIREL